VHERAADSQPGKTVTALPLPGSQPSAPKVTMHEGLRGGAQAV
jgi:hypothetical protein